MYHFCTLFDRNYLFKGLALHASLVRHCPAFTLHILCMDALAFELLHRMQLDNVKLIALADFEDADLRQAKAGRTAAEYCWTCTPSLPLFVFEHNPEVDLVTYLDADLYFYSDPTPIFAEFGPRSIVIIEHRFASGLEHLAINGIYNVEWVSFRRDADGLACLHWWRERCNEWCYNRLEEGKMGDQKYLDDWTTRFSNVHVLQHVGAGLAPWNFQNYRIFESDGQLLVNDQLLIFYHFHQFQLISGRRYSFMSSGYTENHEVPAAVYSQYIAQLERTIQRVQEFSPRFSYGIQPYVTFALVRSKAIKLVGKALPKKLKERLKTYLVSKR